MLTLLINPAAGNGRSKKIAKAVQERLAEKGIEYRLLITEAPGHATELARRAAEGYRKGDYLITLGGDGTFLETLQGVLGSELPIAAIPAGTGNDFLKSLKVPKEPLEALEHILAAPVRRIDVGRVNGALFANECGAGFDVAVLDYAEKAKKHCRGLLPYLWGVLRAIFSAKPIPMEITADGKTVFCGDCLVFSVANGPYIGGGIHISPEADPESGKLELIVLRNCPRARMTFRYLPGLLQGKILTFADTVVHCRADTVTARPLQADRLRVNVDGEIRDLPACDFSIRPASLPIHM